MTGNKSINDQKLFYEDLVADVKDDFERRRRERKRTERQWQLNQKFLYGEQYCEINGVDEIEETDKYYYWQAKNVYNHIAPIMDTRISRLTRTYPLMSVRAATSDEADLKTAKITTSILNSTWSRIDMNAALREATMWSEVCGTAFYEVVWNGNKGREIGEVDGTKVKEGDVSVTVVSPFGIFPDSMSANGLEDCKSVIHARAMHIADVEARYGVKLTGKDVDIYGLCVEGAGENGDETVAHDSVVVIERFERPSADYPCGRVIAVAEDKLLYLGELPYFNGEDGSRDIPFVMQRSILVAGRFFGESIVERLIPLQRSYNAVKNRKQEFLNRLSMGVFAVEDGSVDVDEFAEEGLSPGRVVVYRQGTRPPTLLGAGNVPMDFVYEEERLTNEFILISGVSEFSRTSQIGSNISSGTALQLLIEQDDARLLTTTEQILSAVRKIAKHIIRLFKQFAADGRIMRIAGENGKVETCYFNSSDVSSDDVIFDTENQLNFTPAQKKSAVYELIGTGLLNDENGRLDERTKGKLLEILGFGSIDNVRDVDRLHAAKAEKENIAGFKEEVPIDEYDDHEIHLAEHTRFLLSEESEAVRNNEKTKSNVLSHLRAHRQAALATAKTSEE
ncbi:MAG: hypothetical protein J5903_01305 [Clostridia bacterium]|nr:hypothetical protein [Clostridia bacterium]